MFPLYRARLAVSLFPVFMLSCANQLLSKATCLRHHSSWSYLHHRGKVRVLRCALLCAVFARPHHLSRLLRFRDFNSGSVCILMFRQVPFSRVLDMGPVCFCTAPEIQILQRLVSYCPSSPRIVQQRPAAPAGFSAV